jgi:hypothetical protein
MNVERQDHDLLRRVASRLIIGYDEQDLGMEVDHLADRVAAEVGACVPCKGTGRASGWIAYCPTCGGTG